MPIGSVFTTKTGLEFVTIENVKIMDGAARAQAEATEPGEPI